MLQQFEPGDFLIFQLESGYALLRVLAVSGPENDPVWHLAVVQRAFHGCRVSRRGHKHTRRFTVQNPHIALTDHAFESTQVAKMGNAPLSEDDRSGLTDWENSPDREVHDRSIRLLLGLR